MGSGWLFSRHRGVRTGCALVACDPRELGSRSLKRRDRSAIPCSRSGDRSRRDAACDRGWERLAFGIALCGMRVRVPRASYNPKIFDIVEDASATSWGLPAHRLKVVKNYIEENLGNPIALHELAGLACVSVRHFERAFRQSLGVPPHRYVLERRVSAARDLLLSHPKLNIEEIARQLGFSSSSHLSSAFVRRMGCSPATFRRMHV
jgi:AraC-like DNA-binding protein